MKKEKFIPGPYFVFPDKDVYHVCFTDKGGLRQSLAHDIEDKPDADLLAAAPDLYEALEAAITEIEWFTDFKISGPDSENEVLNGLYSALAKARGENVD